LGSSDAAVLGSAGLFEYLSNYGLELDPQVTGFCNFCHLVIPLCRIVGVHECSIAGSKGLFEYLSKYGLELDPQVRCW
jgi:hypothetical protein